MESPVTALEDKRARERDRQRARYAYLKAVNRCVRCLKQDAYTLNGRAYCAECEELNNVHWKKYRARNRNQVNEHANERYQRRKDSGLCPRCGRPKDHGGNSPYCKPCMAKRRNTDRKNYGSPYLRCKWCDNMPEPGKAYCRECLDKLARKKKEWWDSVKKAENTTGSRELSAFRS